MKMMDDEETEDFFDRNVSKLSDGELVEYASRAAGMGGFQDEQEGAFLELLERYNNKKKECEAMRVNHLRWTINVRERLKTIEDLAGVSNFRLSSRT